MNVLLYSVFCNFPTYGMDSILVFQNNELACVYRVFWTDTQDLTMGLDLLGVPQISYDQAVYRLEKIKEQKLLKEANDRYASSKRMADQMLLEARKEEVQLAYRASRNYFFQTIRDLQLPDCCGEILNERTARMEEAKAMFSVVRRVFETEIRPIPESFELLNRMFDGAPEEIILALKDYECLKSMD